MVGCLYFCHNAEERRNWHGEDHKDEKGDTLILQSEYYMRKEDIAKEKQWFKDEMGIDVAIINGQYEIKGVKENGEGVR